MWEWEWMSCWHAVPMTGTRVHATADAKTAVTFRTSLSCVQSADCTARARSEREIRAFIAAILCSEYITTGISVASQSSKKPPKWRLVCSQCFLESEGLSDFIWWASLDNFICQTREDQNRQHSHFRKLPRKCSSKRLWLHVSSSR